MKNPYNLREKISSYEKPKAWELHQQYLEKLSLLENTGFNAREIIPTLHKNNKRIAVLYATALK